ncbi:MAG: metal ABC transporter ATP-binding protein [Syntrophomonas sp.]|nr:metal ABC transporter ATP-binding protein [Syntrophomonas sp.]
MRINLDRDYQAKNHFCGLCCTKIENFEVTRGKTEILRNINLHIHCGELTALIGPNGAGKSTLLKAILGEIPHGGNLKYLDYNDHHTSKPIIGYVPQRLDFDAGSPLSILDLFGASRSRIPVWLTHSHKLREHTREVLSRMQAEQLLDRRLGDLSGGELQRVLLALALDPLPDLLLLDEPVSGIDRLGLEMFFRKVADLRLEYDLSIILVSHDLKLVAQYADRVVFLNKTIQCVGTPEVVFNDPKAIQTFGQVLNPENYCNPQKGGSL